MHCVPIMMRTTKGGMFHPQPVEGEHGLDGTISAASEMHSLGAAVLRYLMISMWGQHGSSKQLRQR